MKRVEKVLLFFTAVVFGGVVLLVVLDRLAPRFINLDSTKMKIQAMVTERTGGTIDYERIVPSIFPRPGIELERVSLAVPGTAEVTMRAVRLYPKMLPLLWGQVIVSKLVVQEPQLAINISNLPVNHEEKKDRSSFSYIQKSIKAIMAPLSVRSADLDIEIRKGQLDIVSGTGAEFRFIDVNTYLTSTGKVMNISVTCRSNISRSISITGNMDPETLNVQGTISLVRFRPAVLMKQISSSDSGVLAGTAADLSFTFVLFKPRLIIANLVGKAGHSSFSGVNAELDMSAEEPYVYITSASLKVSLAQVYQMIASSNTFGGRTKDIKSIDGTVDVTSAKVQGPLRTPSAWDFQLRGEVRNVLIDETHLPRLVKISRGTLEAVPQKLTFNAFQTSMLDSSLKISGVLTDYMKSNRSAEMAIQGEVGTETEAWISEAAKIPPAFHINNSVAIKRANLRWSSGSSILLDTDLAVQEGPDLTLELAHSPSETSIKNLFIKDDMSDADIALELDEKELHLMFKGNLDERTVSRMFPSMQRNGWIRGDFEARMPKDSPLGFTASGELEGGNIVVPRDSGIPLIVNTVSLSADKNVITVNRSELGLGEKRFNADGNITALEGDFLLDMHVETDQVSWEDIKENFLRKKEKSKSKEKDEHTNTPHIRGTVKVSSRSFEYKRFRWNPVRAVVFLQPGEVRISIPEAVICDISTPGNITVKDGQVQIDFQGAARKEKLKKSLNCLLGEDVELTGTFDFSGHITAQGTSKELKRAMNGKVKFKARNGTIYRYPLFSRIFSLVNVLEVFKGRYDDIVSKGFPYDSIEVKGDIRKGKLMLREASMDGSTMKIAGEGEVDLTDKDADLILIVSPLRTIDTIIEQIPIIRDITAGTLISIAMKVSGKIDDPKIITLPPSAVGEGIVGMVRRIFKLPLKLFEPESSDKKKK